MTKIILELYQLLNICRCADFGSMINLFVHKGKEDFDKQQKKNIILE